MVEPKLEFGVEDYETTPPGHLIAVNHKLPGHPLEVIGESGLLFDICKFLSPLRSLGAGRAYRILQ